MEATWTQTLPNWTASHVHAFESRRWTDLAPTAGATPIRAAHMELRAAVVALE